MMQWFGTKILAGVSMGLVVLMVILTSQQKSSSSSNTQTMSTELKDKASGDTNAEVLRELSAKYQQVLDQNKKYHDKIEQLSKQSSTNKDDNTELKRVQQSQQETNEQLKLLQEQMTTLQQPLSVNQAEMPSSNGVSSSSMIGTVTDLSRTKPVNNVPSALNSVSEPITEENKKIPYYTIPALSNLANTSLMTSLIGEVPQGNNFPQPPFPFLAIVGKEQLLAANGMHLPGSLAGMKISGYSVGVGSFVQGFACTRSYITKVLFVFDDGHFVVHGNDAGGNSIDPADTLGYLSDPYGNPCMKGKYITNAPRVLTLLMGASAISGFGDAVSQSQVTTLTGYDGGNTLLTGDAATYAAGKGVAEGLDQASEYIKERLKGTFDVVYIPASLQGHPTKVVANFTQTIPIDLEQQGRQLRYDNTTKSTTSLHSLD